MITLYLTISLVLLILCVVMDSVVFDGEDSFKLVLESMGFYVLISLLWPIYIASILVIIICGVGNLLHRRKNGKHNVTY